MRRWIALGTGIAIAVGGTAGAIWYRFRPGGRGAERLENLTKEELYERARAKEIPGRSEMSKEDLIRALRSASS
jgi:hypothetical protein